MKLKLVSYFIAILAPFFLVIGLAGPMVYAQDSQTQIDNSLCVGSGLDLNGDPSGADCTSSDATTTFNNLVSTIINLLSVLVGVVAVIMIMVGGLRYITSGGRQESVSSAKNTILYAIIGLVIVALAQIIVQFVLSSVTSS